MDNNNGGKGSGCGFIFLILVLLAIIGSCMGDSTSSGSDSKRCEVCNKTFTNKDDVKSITWTNMCEPCYENYKFSQELREELVKYSERN